MRCIFIHKYILIYKFIESKFKVGIGADLSKIFTSNEYKGKSIRLTAVQCKLINSKSSFRMIPIRSIFFPGLKHMIDWLIHLLELCLSLQKKMERPSPRQFWHLWSKDDFSETCTVTISYRCKKNSGQKKIDLIYLFSQQQSV